MFRPPVVDPESPVSPEMISQLILRGNHVGMLTPQIISAEAANYTLWAEFERLREADRARRRKSSKCDSVEQILKEARQKRRHASGDSSAGAQPAGQAQQGCEEVLDSPTKPSEQLVLLRRPAESTRPKFRAYEGPEWSVK